MIRDALPAAGVFVLVAALGFDEGGYSATSWGWSAILVFAVLAFLVARGVGRPRPAALVLVGALAALALWTAASIAWSDHQSASVLEVERIVSYLGVASLVLLAATGPALPAGVLAAATLLCAYGLIEVEAGRRLAEPIGYANGMAMLAVVGLLLAVGFTARASRRLTAAASGATAPMLAATLYFTFGRGAWLALAAGLVAAVAVGPARLQLAAAAAALALPAALAVTAAERLGPSTSLGGILVILTVFSAAVPLAVRSSLLAYRPSPSARRAFGAALVGLPIVLAVAALVKLGGPEGAYDSFRAAPAPTHGDPESRVFSLSGRNRADYWAVAWESYEAHPALGAGAGTFARTWLRERPVPQPVTDAHSLYLEALAELGPLGLALLLVALAVPLAAGKSRWTPIALGPYAAFLVHAAQDWDWELPAVTVAALACGVAPIAGQTRLRLPRLAATVPAVLCLLAAVAFLGNQAVATSQAASDRLDWAEAEDAARQARSLQPWSPEPWRLLGEIELAEGSLAVARRDFRRGLEKDREEFELWIGLGLASDGAAQRAAFERAHRLNPLSPELRELGFKTGSGG